MPEPDTPADDSPDSFQPSERGWVGKFSDAIRGVRQGVSGQSSFIVHFLAAVLVLVCAGVFQLPLEHWCLLLICIGAVFTAELFNSALECLCRSVTDQFDPNIQQALDIASGAVLVVSVASAIVGSLIFLNAIA